MSVPQSDFDRLGRGVASSLHDHWRFYLIEGILLIALGLVPAVPVIVPPIADLPATNVLGWAILISGMVGLFMTLRTRGVPGFWWALISAILAMLIGTLLIGRPISGAFWLTVLLIAFFIIEGVVSIMFALDHRQYLAEASGWMLASGIVDLLLAVAILAGLAGLAVWALSLFVGLNLAVGGVALVAMALEARRINPTAPAEF